MRTIIDRVLTKSGKAVVLYRKYDGYAVSLEDLKLADTIFLVTPEGQKLKAHSDDFRAHGFPNTYQGEEQLVLPTKYFRVINQGELFPS